MSRRLVILLCCGVSFAACHAQENGGIFYQLNTSAGLSSNRTQDIIQDREGFYWIATQDGLNRFDGSSCKVYRYNRNDSTSLPHNNCSYLLEDENGDIWVGTQMGLCRYRKKEDKFQRFYLSNPTYPFQEVNSIRALAKDNKGNIWIASAGLWQYNIYSGRWKNYINNVDDDSSIPSGFIFLLQYDSVNNGLWMSGRTGVIFFDLASHAFHHAQHNPNNSPIFKTDLAGGLFSVDAKGTIWFQNGSTYELSNYSLTTNMVRAMQVPKPSGISGLFVAGEKVWIPRWAKGPLIYDPGTNTIDSTFLINYNPRSPSSFLVSRVYTDRSGVQWIATDKGVNIFDPAAQNVKYYVMNLETFRTAFSITCIAESNENVLWIGTNQGLFEYHISERKYEKIAQVKVTDDFVRCLYMQGDSVLWIGGHHELLRFDIKREKLLDKIFAVSGVQSILSDDADHVWAATWQSGLFKFSKDGKQWVHYEKGQDVQRTPASNKLICVSSLPNRFCLGVGYNGGNGFSVFHTKDGTFEHFKIGSDAPYYIGCNTINCIAPDGMGNLWLGTHGGGLVCFNQNKNSFKTYTQSDGLKGDFVHSISIDDSSRMWVTTSNGLCIVEPSTGSIIDCDIDLSLSTNDFVPNGIHRKNGKFLFFAGNKIIEVNPALFDHARYDSKILLSRFKIFDEEIPFSQSMAENQRLSLSYQQNFFSIEYSLLKPNPASPVHYAYKLDGFDKDWNYTKERRVAYYTNIPPGHYLFHVKAANERGKWVYLSNAIYIDIIPPLWQRWWFVILVGLILSACLYLLYRFRVTQVKKFYSLRNKISQDLHDEVASTLSGIRLYSELAKQQLQKQDVANVQQSLKVISENASEMKEDMSDIIWAINPGNDSLGRLLQKLSSYANELTKAASMNFEMKIAENLPEEKLNMEQRRNIYLICKEAIHNSVKYSKAIELHMDVLKRDHSMHIVISDNGCGFQPDSTSAGNGLINMKARAKEIGAALAVESGNGGGTVVELKMKI